MKLFYAKHTHLSRYYRYYLVILFISIEVRLWEFHLFSSGSQGLFPKPLLNPSSIKKTFTFSKNTKYLLIDKIKFHFYEINSYFPPRRFHLDKLKKMRYFPTERLHSSRSSRIIIQSPKLFACFCGTNLSEAERPVSVHKTASGGPVWISNSWNI